MDGKLPYSVINCFDENHIVDRFSLENIIVSGTRIKNMDDFKVFNQFARNVILR